MPRERPKLGCGDRGQACHRPVRRLPRHILTDLLKATKLSRGSFYAAWGAFLHALDGYIGDLLVRLDAEIDALITALEGNLLSGLVQAIAGSTTERRDDITIAASAGSRSKFAADAEQRRQEGSLEQGDPMIVDLVLETGKT